MIRNVIFLGLYSAGIYLSYKRISNKNNLKHILKFFIFMTLNEIVEIVGLILNYNASLFYRLYSEKGPYIFGKIIFIMALIMIVFDVLAFVQIIIFLRKYKAMTKV